MEQGCDALLRDARQRAERTNSDKDWEAADLLAIEMARSSHHTIKSMEMLTRHAIQRMGGFPDHEPYRGPPSEIWLDHILHTVTQGLKDIEGVHSQFSAPLMIHSIDHRAVICDTSEAWASALGYRPHEILGQHCCDFVTDESRILALERHLPEFWETGIVTGIRYDFLTKAGKVLPVEMSATAERDQTGTIVRSLTICTLI